MEQNTYFKVEQFCDCTIRITDNTHCLYEDNSNSPYIFGYKDTITLDIVVLNKVDGPQLGAIIYTTHDRGNLNEVYLPLGEDGYYTIYHIILPTVDWFNKQNNQQYNNFKKYKDIYVSNGKNIYLLQNGQLELFNPIEFITNINLKRSTAVKFEQQFFFTCYLWKCYIYLCKQLLNSLSEKTTIMGNHSLKKNKDLSGLSKDLIYRRDFIWATINVLNYLIDACQFEEAEKILEEVQRCNGMCYNIDGRKNITSTWLTYSKNNSTGVILDSGCGCGK